MATVKEIKAKKDKIEYEGEINMPDTLSEAVELMTEEVVYKHFAKAFIVAEQAKLRPASPTAKKADKLVYDKVYNALVENGVAEDQAAENATTAANGYSPENEAAA